MSWRWVNSCELTFVRLGALAVREALACVSLAPLFGVSKSAANRIIGRLGPSLTLQPRQRFRKDAVLIVDGTSCPRGIMPLPSSRRTTGTRPTTRSSPTPTPDSRLVVAVGLPVAGNRNDGKAWALSGAKAAVGRASVIADGGHQGTGLLIPHRRERGQTELPAWKEERKRLPP